MHKANVEPLDPVKVFEDYEGRKEAEKKLQERRWTLEEAQEIQAELSDSDNEIAREAAALMPFIKESNRRGDFRHPWQMSREEAKVYLESKGIKGEPWSMAEYVAAMNDPEIFKDYREELRAVQAAGLIISGPDKEKHCHFAGELTPTGQPKPEPFKHNLNEKLCRFDNRRKARAIIQETEDQVETMDPEKVGFTSVHAYLRRQLDAIDALTVNNTPVKDLPGYAGIAEEVSKMDAIQGQANFAAAMAK